MLDDNAHLTVEIVVKAQLLGQLFRLVLSKLSLCGVNVTPENIQTDVSTFPLEDNLI